MGILEHEFIARDAYIYGLPMVEGHQTLVSYAALNAGLGKRVALAPLAEKSGLYGIQAAPSLGTRDRPSCSFIWLDLRAEPFVLRLPPADPRGAYSVHLLDLYMRRFAYVTPQLAKGSASHFLLVGPDWYGDLPHGIEQIFRAETSLVQVIHRGWRSPEHHPSVTSRAEATDFFEPMSSFLHGSAPPPVAVPQWPYHALDVTGTLDFFTHLDSLLQFCPRLAEERALMARFAQILIGRGGMFRSDRLSAREKGRLRRGMARGVRAVADALGKIDGISELFDPSPSARRDYLKQAAAASAGIYGASAQDAYYLPRYGHAIDPNIVAMPLFYGFRMGPRRKPGHADGEAAEGAPTGETAQPSKDAVAGAAASPAGAATETQPDTQPAPAAHSYNSPGPHRIRYRSARIIHQLNVDAEGMPLDGGERYVLHFDRRRLPPVNDFWSVAARDVRGQISIDQLSSNPLGDASAMRPNADGSLDIYFQPDSPGRDLEANWLPTKPGRFYVLLRLYAPRREILTGAWSAPDIQRIS